MLDANYKNMFKVLGKMSYLYDSAGTDSTSQNTLGANVESQVSSQGNFTLDVVMQSFPVAMNNSISSGAAAQQTLAISQATNYLQSSIVSAYFTQTTVVQNSRAATVVTALQIEMSAAKDNVTLTNVGSTGLVNFLTQIQPSGLWNTAVDGSATYKDSVYSVLAVV